GQQCMARIRQFYAAHGRIERREQLISRVCARAGEPVEQGGFACVRVADERNRRNLRAPPHATRSVALREHLLEACVERLDAGAEQPAVGFELRLARTPQTDAALLPLQVRPASHQASREMTQLCKYELQLTFKAAGPVGEDVEN